MNEDPESHSYDRSDPRYPALSRHAKDATYDTQIPATPEYLTLDPSGKTQFRVASASPADKGQLMGALNIAVEEAARLATYYGRVAEQLRALLDQVEHTK